MYGGSNHLFYQPAVTQLGVSGSSQLRSSPNVGWQQPWNGQQWQGEYGSGNKGGKGGFGNWQCENCGTPGHGWKSCLVPLDVNRVTDKIAEKEAGVRSKDAATEAINQALAMRGLGHLQRPTIAQMRERREQEKANYFGQ